MNGWKISYFGSRRDVEHWAYGHLSKAECEEAKANILKYGQTAILHVRDKIGFPRIELEPVQGKFWVRVPPRVVEGWKIDDWHPHISMTFQKANTVDREVFESVKRRWDGRTECIKIESITQNGR